MIAQGREITIVFQGPAAFGGWARVAFDGEVPTLPKTPPKQPPTDDSGFWPDDVPPDD